MHDAFFGSCPWASLEKLLILNGRGVHSLSTCIYHTTLPEGPLFNFIYHIFFPKTFHASIPVCVKVNILKKMVTEVAASFLQHNGIKTILVYKGHPLTAFLIKADLILVFQAIPVNSQNKAAAIVVGNVIASMEAIFTRAQPERWGALPAFDANDPKVVESVSHFLADADHVNKSQFRADNIHQVIDVACCCCCCHVRAGMRRSITSRATMLPPPLKPLPKASTQIVF